MNPLALILMSVTGLLGVYLFILYGGQHQERQREAVIQHRLESERFDQDFRAAWNGDELTPDPNADIRIGKLKDELAEIEKRREMAEAETRSAAKELKTTIEGMSK